jgi:hypothetical protein
MFVAVDLYMERSWVWVGTRRPRQRQGLRGVLLVKLSFWLAHMREKVHPLKDGPPVASVSPNTHIAVGSCFEPALSTTHFSLNGARRQTLFARRASGAPIVLLRNGAINRQDLIKSDEHIFRCFVPSTSLGEESYHIYLPPTFLINIFPLNGEAEAQKGSGRSVMTQVPGMLHAQKEYAFRVIKQDAFPRFLRAKALANFTLFQPSFYRWWGWYYSGSHSQRPSPSSSWRLCCTSVKLTHFWHF